MKKNKLFFATLAGLLTFCLLGCRAINEDVFVGTQAEVISAHDFVYSYLSDEEKLVYDELYDAVYNFESEVVLSNSVDEEDLKKIFTLFYTQESQVFWLDSLFVPNETGNGFNLVYRTTKDEASELSSNLQITICNIADKLNEKYSEYDAVRLFHDEIVLKTRFCEDGDFVNSAYGALVLGEAMCEGYAFAMSYLCDYFNIENYIVNGENVDGKSHVWNKIKIDGDWYNLDSTWDDPIFEIEKPNYVRHNFMLLPDDDIYNITHFPYESVVNDVNCVSEKYNYFVFEELTFETAEQLSEKLPSIIASYVGNDKLHVEVRMTNEDEYLKAYDIICKTDYLELVMDDLNAKFGFNLFSVQKRADDNLFILGMFFNDGYSK